jgi:hypothetical protein
MSHTAEVLNFTVARPLAEAWAAVGAVVAGTWACAEMLSSDKNESDSGRRNFIIED